MTFPLLVYHTKWFPRRMSREFGCTSFASYGSIFIEPRAIRSRICQSTRIIGTTMGTEGSLVLLQKSGCKQDNYQELRTIFPSGYRGSFDLCDLPDNQVHMDYGTMGFI